MIDKTPVSNNFLKFVGGGFVLIVAVLLGIILFGGK
jgi:hypothetical protein